MKAGRKYNDQKNAQGIWQPSKEQAECIMLDFEGVKHNAIAEKLNITEQVISKWFRDENFNNYREKEREIIFRQYGPHIDKSLIKQGLKGNVGAIRAYYEKRGETGVRQNDGVVAIQINLNTPIRLGKEEMVQIDSSYIKLVEGKNGGNGENGNGKGEKNEKEM